MSAEIASRLQEYYADHVPAKPNAVIREVANITTGWECDLYAYSMEHSQGSNRLTENLVMRLYSGKGAQAKAAHEFRSIKRLHEEG